MGGVLPRRARKFIHHLRLGQVNFELSNLDIAADELIRAYMGDGETVFEQEYPKYFSFLRTRAKIYPEGSEPSVGGKSNSQPA